MCLSWIQGIIIYGPVHCSLSRNKSNLIFLCITWRLTYACHCCTKQLGSHCSLMNLTCPWLAHLVSELQFAADVRDDLHGCISCCAVWRAGRGGGGQLNSWGFKAERHHKQPDAGLTVSRPDPSFQSGNLGDENIWNVWIHRLFVITMFPEAANTELTVTVCYYFHLALQWLPLGNYTAP